MGIFTIKSGLSVLGDRYKITQQPEGTYYSKQTVQIGAVRYRQCVTIGLCDSGLFLWAQPIFSNNPRLLIPWPDIKVDGPAKIYHNQAVALSIGDPAVGHIRVYKKVYQLMAPYVLEGEVSDDA